LAGSKDKMKVDVGHPFSKVLDIVTLYSKYYSIILARSKDKMKVDTSHPFSKVLDIVTLCIKYPGALTFQNLFLP
jgi:hypothetical protein